MTKLQPREIGLIAAACALAADQGSKLFMLYGAGFAHMPPGVSVPVLPFFNLASPMACSRPPARPGRLPWSSSPLWPWPA